MPHPPLAPSRFFAELKRRRVFRVAGVYAVAAWAVIQVADTVLPRLGLPDWSVTLVIVLAMLGLPLALILAWAFDLTPEGIERTEPLKTETPGASTYGPRGSPRRLGAAAVALALTLGLVWAGIQRTVGPAAQAADGSSAVAVLPFSVRGGDGIAYLAEGMVNLLATNLDGVGELRSVDPKAVLSVAGGDAAGADRARAFAERLGARFFVTGDVTEAAGQVRINAALHDTGGGEPVTATASGRAEEIFGLIDRLTAQLLAGRQGRQGTGLAQATTESLPALKFYLEGERALQRFDFPSAFTAFQSAVQEDTAFSLAHYGLARAAMWIADEPAAREAIRQTVARAGRLSTRDQRLVAAYDAFIHGRADEAEQLYRAILVNYPHDVEANYNLGELLFHGNFLRGRFPTEGREPLERVLAFQPTHSEALFHLTHIAAFENRWTDAKALGERWLAANEHPEYALMMQPFLAMLPGADPAARERVFVALEGASDLTVAVGGWMANALDSLEYSRRAARLLTRPGRPATNRAIGHSVLAEFALAEGRVAAAERELALSSGADPSLALLQRGFAAALPFRSPAPNEVRTVHLQLATWDPARTPQQAGMPIYTPPYASYPGVRLYLLGLLDVKLGKQAAALARADSLDALPSPEQLGTLFGDLAGGVRAEVAGARGDSERALALLLGTRRELSFYIAYSSPVHSLNRERFRIAELLNATGRDDEALRWYRSLLLNLSIGGRAFAAPAHLRMAEIYQRRGLRDDAVRHYTDFLQLWNGADPELRPMVDDARRRLARLDNNFDG